MIMTILHVIFYLGSYAVDSLRFLIIGDMGGLPIYPYYTYFERCTAEEMGKVADRYAPQYVLELGDNFYFDGVKNIDDARFKVILAMHAGYVRILFYHTF